MSSSNYSILCRVLRMYVRSTEYYIRLPSCELGNTTLAEKHAYNYRYNVDKESSKKKKMKPGEEEGKKERNGRQLMPATGFFFSSSFLLSFFFFLFYKCDYHVSQFCRRH
jgi:hypothetical protein